MNLKEQIEEYIPYNEQEKSDKELILKYIDTFEDVLTRENKICHFTVTNWITNRDRNKVLMAHHNIFNAWAWTGGHADGDSNLLHVALKEAREETGIESFKILKDKIFGLEIIAADSHIKNGKFVPTHIHLNCTYIFEANEENQVKVKEDENSGVKWIDINEIPNIKCDKKVINKLYEKYSKKMLECKL